MSYKSKKNHTMEKGNIPFSIFQKQVYDKLNREELNELFFWSLIKTGYGEGGAGEEADKNFIMRFSLEKRKKVIMDFLKKSQRVQNQCKKDHNLESKMYTYFTNEKLTNYILALEIHKALKGKNITDYDIHTEHMQVYNQNFPDIVFKGRKTDGFISIEIKTILSTSRLRDKVLEEVMPHLSSKKENLYIKNFLLLFLFPCAENERTITQSLIGGYYVYEDVLNHRKIGTNKANSKKLLNLVVPEKSQDDTLSYIVEKIINNEVFDNKRVV